MSKIISCGERTVQVKERIALSDIAKKYDIEPGDIVRVTIQKVEDEKDENEMIKEVLFTCEEFLRLSQACMEMAVIDPFDGSGVHGWKKRTEQEELYLCATDSEFEAMKAIKRLRGHFDGTENVSGWYKQLSAEYTDAYNGISDTLMKFLNTSRERSIQNLNQLMGDRLTL